MTNDDSDEALSRRASTGCRASFEALLERHYDRIYRLAWRWSGSREAAEDIAQDVCVKLAGAIENYRAEARFSTWLHRIAYTTALDHIKIHQRLVPVEPSEIITLVDRNTAGAGGDNFAPVNFEHGEIWAAVRALPGQQRDAVLLVYGEDMSHAQAAALMGCAEKTVSWHLHEAKKKLRILLEAVG